MAIPLTILLLGAGAAGYLLLASPPKPKTPAATGPALPPVGPPVVVPAGALPTPPGGTPPEQMPGGPPTVVVSPPATSAQTPQQLLTQALPQLVASLPNVLQPTGTKEVPPPGATPSAGPPVVKEIPAPGGTPAPAAAAPPAPPASVLTQLPQQVTQVLQQAQSVLAPATPLQTTETAPALDPNGTIALAKALIDAESLPNWKSALQPAVKAWQAKVGLVVDGKFGEKGEQRMAQEVGILPLIRYWPANTQPGTEVPKYRAAIEAIAKSVQSNNPAHAAALRSSAAYETGQAYAGNPPAVPVSMRQGQATFLTQTLKQ